MQKEMPLIAHLEELRWALIKSLAAVIVFAVPCGIFWQQIFDFIAVYPLSMSDPAVRIIYTAPAETVMLSFKIALCAGAVIASPFIFLQMWNFISPGLYKNEKALIIPAVIASTICFLAGITFCYFLLPIILRFMTTFADGGAIEPYFKIGEYFGFLMRLCLAFGLAFELPVIAFVLSRMNVIDHKFLLRHFKIAVILVFVFAAILTPPDILSQTLLALPLVLLYLLSVGLAYRKPKNYVA